MNRVLALFTIIGCTCMSGQVQKFSFCESDLKLNLPSNFNEASVGTMHFVSGIPFSYGEFTFTNRSPRSIRSVFLVAEFRDQDARFLFGSSLLDAYGTSADVGTKFKEYKAHSFVQELHSLAPATSRTMAFEVPFASTTCPASAMVTAAEIRYSDGKTSELMARDLRRDAELVSAKVTRGDLPSNPPLEVSFTIGVDANGFVRLLSTISEPRLQQWLEDQIRSWYFRPALISGVPTATEIPVLLRIHKRWPDENPVQIKGLPARPFQVIDIVANTHDGQDWELFWSGERL
jgi:hypothetical protein